MNTLEKNIHGVQVDALRSVEETLRSEPSKGSVKFQVHDVWSSPARHRTTTGDISGPMVNHHRAIPHVVDGDEPEPLLGTDKNISPVELLLTAVTHCVGTTFSYHAALQGIELQSMEVNAQGTIDLQGFLGTNPEIPARLSEIELSFLIKSDAEPSKLKDLVEIAVERSPVTNTVKHGTRVVASLS